MTLPSRRAVLAALLWAVPAAAYAQAPYPDSTEGLRRLAADMLRTARAGDWDGLARLSRGLELKDAGWFRRTFGDEAGARLAAEYAKMAPSLEPELRKLMGKVVQDHAIDIEALRADRADDPQMPGAVQDALAAMRQPQPLYLVRFKQPGASLGQTLFAFVYVDGGFRLIGKMRALKA